MSRLTMSWTRATEPFSGLRRVGVDRQMPFAIDEKSSALARVCNETNHKSLSRASCAGLLPFKDGKFSAQEVLFGCAKRWKPRRCSTVIVRLVGRGRLGQMSRHTG